MSTATAMSTTAGTLKGGRKSASLPPKTVEYLKAWMMSPEHVAHPYPTEQEKAQIMSDTGIELKQLTNWFVNNRKRYWKPRVEAKLQKKKAPIGSLSPSSVQGIGRLSVPLTHVNHNKPSLQLQQHQRALATSLPMLLKPSTPLFLQGQGTGRSALDHTSFGPATGGFIRVLPTASSDEDAHAISEGSGSSACNSDEESTSTFSASRRSSLATSCTQYFLDTRFASVGGSSVNASAVPLSDGLCPPMNTIQIVSPSQNSLVSTSKTLPLSRSRDSLCSDVNQEDNNANPAPRKRAKTDTRSVLKGEDEWKKLCQNAKSLYCESLPDLDEAAVMFGYVS